MIQVQLKLKLTDKQERQLNRWQLHLAAVWNWAVKRIERDAEQGIYHSSLEFRDVLVRHGAKIGVPQDAMRGTLWTAHTAWQRCFKKLSRKPRLKGRRNRLNSIAFAHGAPVKDGRISVPVLGKVRFHKQRLPEGRVSQFRLIKRPSGWYACLFFRSDPIPVTRVAAGAVGIDPGFKNLLALSTGEIVNHPRELERATGRIAQSQRGHNRKLTARLQERVANRRKDRNHKLSHRLIAENTFVAFSRDRIRAIAKRFGRSVSSSGHNQLRSMISYKASRTGDTIYVEPESKNSTMRCSNCKALTGPSGLRSLAVRQWTCGECGTTHDRDVNAAVNTLLSGLELAHERKVA